MSVYAAFFMGQFGYVFSPGIPWMAHTASGMGIAADVFGYTDVTAAQAAITQHWGKGDKIALVGYSLGCTTATWLQTQMECDLLCCIAESTFGQNHPVNKKNTKHSVLWHAEDPLSSAGLNDGFDVVHELGYVPHVWMDISGTVRNGVITELSKLKE